MNKKEHVCSFSKKLLAFLSVDHDTINVFGLIVHLVNILFYLICVADSFANLHYSFAPSVDNSRFTLFKKRVRPAKGLKTQLILE